MIRHVVVRGRVQGVGYRAFVEDEASRRGLGGWVRNRRDGTVQAVFSGAADAVDAMLDACRKGPPGSRVEDVEVNEATEKPVAGPFKVLPTI